MNQAIGELIEKAEQAGIKSGSDISFTQKETHSVEQAALKLGLSAKYLGFSIKSQLDASRSADERTVTAYFVQNMFTISMVLPQTPESVFSNAFTKEVLDKQTELGNIGPDNIPTYVSNIVYGRILKFSFTSTASEKEIRATLNAAYKGVTAGGSVDLDLSQKKILNEAKIGLVTVGGEGENALAIIRSGDLKAYFKEDASLTSARPLSYTIRNLGDNSIAKVSETTNYNIKECTPRSTSPETVVKTLPSTRILGFTPPHTRGDRDFNGKGKGPFVEIRTSIVANNTTIKAKVFMTAQEGRWDWTTAEGEEDYVIHQNIIEPGWRIRRILSDTSSLASYTDDDHDTDILSLGSNELVNRFEVIGDTKGDEAGTKTSVSVFFNPIRVELEKIQE